MDTRPVDAPYTALFQGIGTDEWPVLLAQATRLELEVGQPVCLEGSESDAFFVLLEGTVTVTAKDRLGQDQVLAKLGPGAILGETSIFLGDRYWNTISAISACTLLRLPLQAFKDRLAAGNMAAVRVLYNIAQSLAARLQATDALVVRPGYLAPGNEGPIIRLQARAGRNYFSQ